jgi:hypothetical protein
LRGLAINLTEFAGFLVGERHGHLRESWLADLRGTPENGRPLSPRQQLRYGRGFLAGAVRIRLADIAAWAGGRLDWVLVSEKRTLSAIAGAVAVMSAYTFAELGLLGLVTNAENIAAAGAGLYGAAFALRQARGVRPTPRRGDDRPPP